jgi:exopolysaccharide/PEP-CTERM locus tyrosine autokinase
VSLVEQAIARLRNQASAAKTEMPKTGMPDAASKSVTLPIVNTLPDPAKSARRKSLDTNTLRARGYLPEEGQDRQFAEQYRRIKRPLVDKALSGTTTAGEPRVIMITSALPGDGKTFTSINLAMSMALERDISVLLVDCDVAKRHVSEIVGMKEEAGLLDALVDESVDIESLVAPTNLRNLSILPAGTRVEATAELLSSNRMRQIIASLCSRVPRRILLLDSPPLLITNEGQALVKIAGQIVLVVRAGHTPRQAVQDAIALFDVQQAGGLILNQVQASKKEGYYGYGYYGANGDAS